MWIFQLSNIKHNKKTLNVIASDVRLGSALTY